MKKWIKNLFRKKIKSVWKAPHGETITAMVKHKDCIFLTTDKRVYRFPQELLDE